MADDVEIRIVGKDEASSTINSIKGALGGIATVAGGLLAAEGLKALVGGIQDSIRAAQQSQIVEAQTAAVIKSTGDASGLSAAQFRQYAAALEGSSTFSRDTIQQGENMLATFTNIGQNTFPQATQAVTDMTASFQAAGKGMNISDIAIMVGKALNDPVKGMTALQRVGVAFTEDQKKVVAEMIKTGNVAGAQQVILAELNKEFGGSASAQAGTYAGQMAILGNRFEDMKIAVGEALIPVLTKLAGAVLPVVTSMMEKIPAVIERITPALQRMAAFAAEAFQRGFAFVRTTVIPAVERLAATLAGPAHTALTMARDAAQQFGQFLTSSVEPVVRRLATLLQANWRPALVGVGAVIVGIVVPALIAWAVSAAAAAVATIAAALPVIAILAAVGAAAALLYKAWTSNFLGIQGIVAAVWAVLQPILEAIKANLEAFAATTLPKLIAAWENVKAKIEQVVNAIAPIIEAVFGRIAAFIEAHGAQIKAILQGAWDVIKGIVQIDVAIIEGVIKVALDLISGNWSGAWNDMKAMFQGIWDGFKEIVSGAFEAVQGEIQIGIDAIKGLFSGAAGWLVQAGHDLVMGLVNGIAGAIGAAVSAAENVAKSVISAVTSFGHSPWPSMVQAGFDAAQGLAIGMQLGTPMVAAAAAAMAGVAIPGVRGFGGRGAGAIPGGSIATVVPPASGWSGVNRWTNYGPIHVHQQPGATLDQLLKNLR